MGREQARLGVASTRIIGAWVVLLALLPGADVRADDVRPVSVQVRERAPGEFLVQWQVPTVLPAGALPMPVLPDGCESQGQRTIVEQPGTWVLRRTFHCPDGIAGRSLGVDFPIANPSITTLIRLELLSGEQLVHVLQPGEETWQVPAPSSGALPPLVRKARRALLLGGAHLFGNGLHLIFLFAICLHGATSRATGISAAVRLVTGFSGGQLLGAVAAIAFGVRPGQLPIELGLAVAVVILATQTLEPAGQRRPVVGVVAVAGVAHGLGLGALVSSGWIGAVAAALGMDALLLTGALILTWVGGLFDRGSHAATLKKAASYGLGGAGVAAALVVALLVPDADVAALPREARPPGLGSGESGDLVPGSRRVAPNVSDAPIQSFLAIEAFEIRHEILLRPVAFAERLGLPGVEVLEPGRQPEVERQAAELLVSRTSLTIDGQRAEPLVDRVDFLTVGATGVLPRPEPVPEELAEAWLGFTIVYTTLRTPDEVTLTWNPLPESDTGIPVTVTDPETTLSSTLTSEKAKLVWRNELASDPVPTLVAVAADPVELSIPLMSLALLIAASALGLRAVRGRRRDLFLAPTRVLLALALVVAPMGRVALAVPGSAGSAPSRAQARRVLAGTLRNVYRALEFRDESLAYDRLSVSVTGDALSEVYLEHRRAMEMEERGGARARVEVVEVPEVRSVEEVAEGGFLAEAVWIVGGTVTHFGHRHFRQNRYDAEVTLIADDGIWKIHSIEILDEERLR